MLASASDHHIFDKLGFASKEEAIEKYLQPIGTALENNIVPRIHLEDCTRADIYGWVIPFMQRVLDESKGIAKFRICDTIGWGSPDPYAALPWGIPRLFTVLREETGAELEFHGHNDFGLATANSIASWRYGGKKVNMAFAGLGERTGNTSLEQIDRRADPPLRRPRLRPDGARGDATAHRRRGDGAARPPADHRRGVHDDGRHPPGRRRATGCGAGRADLPAVRRVAVRAQGDGAEPHRIAVRLGGHHLGAQPRDGADGQGDAREGDEPRREADLRPHPGRVQRPVRRAARPLGELAPYRSSRRRTSSRSRGSSARCSSRRDGSRWRTF